MKLQSAFCKRNLALIYLVMFILFSLTIVNIPVKSQDEVSIYVKMPDGYIPGVTVGAAVDVEVWIESPQIWTNTNSGIVGWAMDVHVDPAVLKPLTIFGATSGYFLYDFIDSNFYYGYEPKLLKTVDQPSGNFTDVAEFIFSWETLGLGAGGSGKLCTLRYQSLSATAYTLIDLIDVYYYTPAGKFAVDIVGDGHYNQPPVSYHNLTVESTPIQGINFTIDGTTKTTNWSDALPEGNHTITMPSIWTVDTTQYKFVEWENNSTTLARIISLTENKTITATYELYTPPVSYYNLTVESTPIDGIDFTVDTMNYTTNATVSLLEGNYTVTMPSLWVVGSDQYKFMEWEDSSTNPVRTTSLTSNKTITATYELFVPTVRVYVKPEYPEYIPGVPINTTVDVEVWIESPPEWENTEYGIVGWSMNVHVDPTVLKPLTILGTTSGYFLHDFLDNNGYYEYSTSLLKTVNKTTGDFMNVAEYIMSWEGLGVGAGGSGLLCTLRFQSLSETNYTLIDLGYPLGEILTVYYYTLAGKLEANYVGDGHYNQPSIYNLTVESTPIQGINFTIGSANYMTNATVSLLKGSYTVTMPDPWMVGTDKYKFVEWENSSTDPVRTISLTENMTITATYVPVYNLTVESTPIDGISFTIGTKTYTTNTTVELEEGSYTVTMPETKMVGTDKYYFRHWENSSTDPVRTISLTSNMAITATYELTKNYTLTVESTPIDGISFTIGTKTYTTNTTVELEEGSYTVTMPETKMVGTDKYYFRHWENSSTNRVRTVSLTSNMTITATYELPKKYTLTVNSSPITGINFTVDGKTHTTNWSGPLNEGDYLVKMPSTWTTAGGDIYIFDHWEDDSTYRIRLISLTENRTITATYGVYVPPVYNLTVESTPIDGINFTIDTTTYTTNSTVSLLEGTYTVSMPSIWSVGADQYKFTEWEDHTTNPIRTISLTSNMTIIATYEVYVPPVYNLTVESTPIDGVDFTIGTTTYTTNATVELEEGSHTVVMPSTWTTAEGKVYNFIHWEDASTSPSRVVSLTSNMTITATYERELVPPVASFTLSPTKPIVAETVTFNASASNDPDGTVASYEWNFGDGTSDSGAIVEHAYTSAGKYNVTLTVTDNDGLTHTITKSITVEEPPLGIPWYLYVAAAGAAAIIIAAIAFYFLRIKKPKPT